MKRSWDDDQEVENLAMANCLMLMNRVGGSASGRVFHCKTCNKEFPSFQALGGHRTSHKKQVIKPVDHESPPKAKTHECSICGLEFELGQALGGHMRRHRGSQPLKSVPVTVVEEVDGGGRGLCLDLNLTPFQNELKIWRRSNGTTEIAI